MIQSDVNSNANSANITNNSMIKQMESS